MTFLIKTLTLFKVFSIFFNPKIPMAEEALNPDLEAVYTRDTSDLEPGQVLAEPPPSGEVPTEPVEAVTTAAVNPASAATETTVSTGLSTISMVLIGVGVVLVLWIIATYNALIKGRLRVKEAWSDIDVQLKRRYNLIPNLVEAVKGYMGHEREVLENVTKARSAAIDKHGNPEEQGKAENMLSGALKTLFAVTESYPDLKANQSFLDLQNELTDTEDKIQAARRFYNGNVRDYNIKIQTFPNNMLAGLFRFHEEKFFELENEGEREVVAVDFSKK